MEKIENRNLRSLSLEELKEEMVRLGEKGFRGEQIFDWLHKKLVGSYDEMTNISDALKRKLAEHWSVDLPEVVDLQTSKADGTKKFLLRLWDGNVIESVWMKYRHGNSVCISSQVGCRMGCKFCASTLGGLTRNLEAAEMLGQVYQIRKVTKEPVSSVVVMGSGEPLDNYDHLLRFIYLLTDNKAFGLSQRSLTVSTCGLVGEMKKLADEKLQITLAVSLHAPTDERRQALMPIANRYSIEELLDACRYYFEKTGRRLTFEYSLTGGKNDREEDALRLAALLKGLNCHVNLIPVNPVVERGLVSPAQKVIDKFKNNLEKNGINVTIRREMGRDIDGACGQLRKRYMDDQSKEIQI